MDTVQHYREEKDPRNDANGTTNIEMDSGLGQPNDETDDLPEKSGFLASHLKLIGSSTESFVKNHNRSLRILRIVILNMAVFAYFFVALSYWINYEQYAGWRWCDGFGFLLILFSLVYFFLIYYVIVKPMFGHFLHAKLLKPTSNFYDRLSSYRIVRVLVYALLAAGVSAFIVYDTWGESERLVSLLGLVILLLLGFIFSKYPGQIKWRPVITGVALQFIFGLVTIRWYVGRAVFRCLGDKVATFLNYTTAGASFVFGDQLVIQWAVFAFSALTVIFFFSMMVEILSYWGVTQWIFSKLGWILQVTCQTTVCESVISVANVFLGVAETSLLIKPYLKDLTPSEIHVVMSSGFATVSGTILAAYISFGAEPAYLITASVMSAPAAICYSKLLYPETRRSKTSMDNIQMTKSEDTSALGAATSGATAGIALVLGIIANLVAFISFVAFINGMLNFFGTLVGLESLTLEWICGKVFIPLSWIMGVPWEECETVGTLIGIKTIVNEFVAYQKMGEFKAAGLLSARAEIIATYALCGFSNPGTAAIMIGLIGAMAPKQRETLVKVALRAFFSGCAVCFMTACFAGLLTSSESHSSIAPLGATNFTSL